MKRTYCPKGKENHSKSSFKYEKNPMLRLEKRKIEKESLREVMHERFYRTEYSYSNSYQF